MLQVAVHSTAKILCTWLIVMTAAVWTGALAESALQNAPAPEEIIVTGTRIERADIDSVGPVTVLDAADIAATGISSLEVLLQRLPAVAGFGGNQTNAYWTANGYGTTQVNLRGLGINRTLVLINGRRVVFGGTGANSSVDLSMIPVALIERIEVLKDGASTAYGADAVAGVVNLITKQSFAGLEITGKFGQTEQRDGQERRFDLTWGRAGERGSLMANFSYQENRASPLSDRVPCPLAANSRSVCRGSSSTIGGRATLPAGARLPDRRVLTENTRINFNQNRGGDGDFYEVFDIARHGFNYNPYFNAVQPIERFTFSAFGRYALTAKHSWFSELTYTRRDSGQPASPATLRNMAYRADHPTNPTGVDFILERRRLLENGARRFRQDVKIWRLVTGLEGALNDLWSYDLAFNWGRNTATEEVLNTINTQRVRQTLDTATCGVNGIPCADYLGFGDVSRAVLDYIGFDQKGSGGNQQLSASANIRGELLSLPAGPLDFAAGVEWREDKGWRRPDPLVRAGVALGNQLDAITGKSALHEAYAEAHIPVIDAWPGVQALDVNLALRYSDYRLFGAADTYKAGFNWQINDAVKLRGTLSTAFRVPNVPELFGGVSEGNLITTDPCSGYGALSPSSVVYRNCLAAGVAPGYTQLGGTILTNRGGNRELQPESADIHTLGLVVEPLAGLSFTVDYFDIDIKDAVREVSGSNKLAACYNSPGLSHEFCAAAHHTRNRTNGDVNFLSTQRFNTGNEVMQGFDLGAAFEFGLAALSHSLSVQATYLKKYQSTAFNGDEPFVFHGFIGDGRGGYPRWRAHASLTSYAERWSGTYSVQMIGKGRDFNAAVGIGARMPRVFYHNLQLSYAAGIFNDALDISIGIDNLFDEKPPRVASWTDGNTDTMTYDLAGRRAYMRLSYSMD